MLGSTHGTLTTGTRPARVAACGDRVPPPAAPGDPRIEGTQDVERDVGGRPLRAAVPDLDRLFRPETLAVIGPTGGEDEDRITREVVAWARRIGARPHTVHPAHAGPCAERCRPSVAELPERIDLAVLLNPATLDAEDDTTNPTLEDLARARPRFVVALGPTPAPEGRESLWRPKAGAKAPRLRRGKKGRGRRPGNDTRVTGVSRVNDERPRESRGARGRAQGHNPLRGRRDRAYLAGLRPVIPR
ncbi:hypothetical protein [Streptomyces sp. URMC 123]|uniref:hypothetical protein n=1 Tax=Streptomyces sp. URMC 123 TaxID=3423403 RepID=UPI003F1D1B52